MPHFVPPVCWTAISIIQLRFVNPWVMKNCSPSEKGSYAILLLNNKTLEITLFAPAGEHLVKSHRAVRILAL